MRTSHCCRFIKLERNSIYPQWNAIYRHIKTTLLDANDVQNSLVSSTPKVVGHSDVDSRTIFTFTFRPGRRVRTPMDWRKFELARTTQNHLFIDFQWNETIVSQIFSLWRIFIDSKKNGKRACVRRRFRFEFAYIILYRSNWHRINYSPFN